MDFSRSQESPAEDQVVYIEELSGDGDYWLSITDAARVCRVQDVSIRRAINRKALPVRRQRAGQNKRTRFVRASDLASAGFPIIDESAAITTEIGKVDVLSIPRQQQQIVQDHQALTLKLGELQETLASSLQQVDAALHQQQERFEISFQSTREEQARQFAVIETHLAQEQEKFQLTLAKTSQQLADEQQALRQDIEQEQRDALARDGHTRMVLETLHQDLEQEQRNALTRDKQLQATVNTWQTMLEEQQQAFQQQLRELAMIQQKSLYDYQQKVNATLQNMQQEALARFVTIEQRLTKGLQEFEQTFDARLSELTKMLEQVQASSESWHQSTATRDQDLKHALYQQQTQIDQHEQLLPLLPYAQQRLATQQDMARWSQALVDLETRLRTAQQRELERYHPLLDLLTPERLEALARLTMNGIVVPPEDR
ncbi:MAG TPA: hypothetical protein VN729_11485 [Ktedonobacteraceae bacterium]|nr:hypothetical protein [Ktedonobacteraceae bacterium]